MSIFGVSGSPISEKQDAHVVNSCHVGTPIPNTPLRTSTPTQKPTESKKFLTINISLIVLGLLLLLAGLALTFAFALGLLSASILIVAPAIGMIVLGMIVLTIALGLGLRKIEKQKKIHKDDREGLDALMILHRNEIEGLNADVATERNNLQLLQEEKRCLERRIEELAQDYGGLSEALKISEESLEQKKQKILSLQDDLDMKIWNQSLLEQSFNHLQRKVEHLNLCLENVKARKQLSLLESQKKEDQESTSCMREEIERQKLEISSLNQQLKSIQRKNTALRESVSSLRRRVMQKRSSFFIKEDSSDDESFGENATAF